MRYENFHGHSIAIGTRQDYAAAIIRALEDQTPTRIITINPEYIVLSRKNPALVGLTQTPAIAIPDGVGLTWALTKRGCAVERFPGSEIVLDVCAYASEKNLKVGILIPTHSLSSRNDIELALQTKFPKLRFVVVVEDSHVIHTLNAQHLDILFVTFGQPRQDIWIAEHLALCPRVHLAMGVGGSFDFISGKRRRAPRLMRQLGVEWLWRLIIQPQRLPRIIRATFGFWYVILTTP